MLSKWQSQWDEVANNKLHEIHPQLGLWPGGSRIIRREESVLARIRIGHTHLTHCFLLKGEDPPQCIACDFQLHDCKTLESTMPTLLETNGGRQEEEQEQQER